MKIPEIAKKLDISPIELRKYLVKLGFDLGKKTKSLRDEQAKKVIEKIEKIKSEKSEKTIIKKEKSAQEAEAEKPEQKTIEIDDVIIVKDFAAKLEFPVTELISILIKNGIMANINQAIDFETASIIAEDLGFKVKKANKKETVLAEADQEKEADVKVRPPVVTIIGHVDHGKTSLLDKIREENIADTESGGITQAISSYQVEIEHNKAARKITFIDTPGHEAFAAMRAHGVKITDLAVLVVAADDGVKPQTVESANFAKAAGVPILVAINKIDKPGADVNRVKKELSKIGLATEDWGGKTVAVEVSAKTGVGIDELLEMILTISDLEPQKTSFKGLAKGVVIESHLDSKIGPTAVVLIQKGELKIGDPIVVGEISGKIRSLINDKGARIKSAFPSDPTTIIGLEAVPKFGDVLYAFSAEKKAKNFFDEIHLREAAKSLVKTEVGIEEIAEEVKLGKIKELNVIIRADVTGSAEAIKDSLQALSTPEVKIKVLHAGVGNITDNDIREASATKALVLAFKTKPTTAALSAAKESGIKIASYDVIYKLIDDVTAALEGLLEPEIVENKTGKAKVLAIFRTTKAHKIVGAKVNSGVIEKGEKVNIFHNKTKTGEGIVESLQVGPEKFETVDAEKECGIGIDTTSAIQVGDKLVFFKTEKILRKLKE